MKCEREGCKRHAIEPPLEHEGRGLCLECEMLRREIYNKLYPLVNDRHWREYLPSLPGAAESEQTQPVTSEDDPPEPDMFRAFIASQAGFNQTKIGEELNVSQPTVSRWINAVENWAKKPGNRVPGVEELPKPTSKPRTFPVDPAKMARWTEDDNE
jgi:hypothetical protein